MQVTATSNGWDTIRQNGFLPEFEMSSTWSNSQTHVCRSDECEVRAIVIGQADFHVVTFQCVLQNEIVSHIRIQLLYHVQTTLRINYLKLNCCLLVSATFHHLKWRLLLNPLMIRIPSSSCVSFSAEMVMSQRIARLQQQRWVPTQKPFGKCFCFDWYRCDCHKNPTQISHLFVSCPWSTSPVVPSTTSTHISSSTCDSSNIHTSASILSATIQDTAQTTWLSGTKPTKDFCYWLSLIVREEAAGKKLQMFLVMALQPAQFGRSPAQLILLNLHFCNKIEHCVCKIIT